MSAGHVSAAYLLAASQPKSVQFASSGSEGGDQGQTRAALQPLPLTSWQPDEPETGPAPYQCSAEEIEQGDKEQSQPLAIARKTDAIAAGRHLTLAPAGRGGGGGDGRPPAAVAEERGGASALRPPFAATEFCPLHRVSLMSHRACFTCAGDKSQNCILTVQERIVDTSYGAAQPSQLHVPGTAKRGQPASLSNAEPASESGEDSQAAKRRRVDGDAAGPQQWKEPGPGVLQQALASATAEAEKGTGNPASQEPPPDEVRGARPERLVLELDSEEHESVFVAPRQHPVHALLPGKTFSLLISDSDF